jgi:hypothetical protein
MPHSGLKTRFSLLSGFIDVGPFLWRFFTATEPNRLMLFKETVAVYCENHTEHTDTVRTSQETHYVFTTEPNLLTLFRETVAVCCENHTEH